MRLSRIPQRVSNALASVAFAFSCPQGQHFRVFCWLLVTLIVSEGGAKLKALTRLMPPSLAYWTVLRTARRYRRETERVQVPCPQLSIRRASRRTSLWSDS